MEFENNQVPEAILDKLDVYKRQAVGRSQTRPVEISLEGPRVPNVFKTN